MMPVSISYSEKDSGAGSSDSVSYTDATSGYYQFQNSSGYQLAEGWENTIYGFIEEYDLSDNYYLGTLYAGTYDFRPIGSDWVSTISDLQPITNEQNFYISIWQTGHVDQDPIPLIIGVPSNTSGTGSGVNSDEFINDPIGAWTYAYDPYVWNSRVLNIEIEKPIEVTVKLNLLE